MFMSQCVVDLSREVAKSVQTSDTTAYEATLPVVAASGAGGGDHGALDLGLEAKQAAAVRPRPRRADQQDHPGRGKRTKWLPAPRGMPHDIMGSVWASAGLSEPAAVLLLR